MLLEGVTELLANQWTGNFYDSGYEATGMPTPVQRARAMAAILSRGDYTLRRGDYDDSLPASLATGLDILRRGFYQGNLQALRMIAYVAALV